MAPAEVTRATRECGSNGFTDVRIAFDLSAALRDSSAALQSAAVFLTGRVLSTGAATNPAVLSVAYARTPLADGLTPSLDGQDLCDAAAQEDIAQTELGELIANGR